MKTITLHDKTFKLFIPYTDIQNAIENLAEKINTDYKETTPLFLVVLNGSFMFASDLLKKISLNCEVSFVKLSSYIGTSSTNNVKQLIGLNESLEGKDIVIIEDIIDSGITMEHMLDQLKLYSPASIKIATLLLKPDALKKDIPIDYVGMRIPNDFIVGYGLDYNGLGRNFPDIYKII